MHKFDRGKVVTVFQMSPSKGLFIEGKAIIRKRVTDVDEQYLVSFDAAGKGYENEAYERFVDTWGQDSPEKYVRDFNKKIGIAA